MPEYATPEWLAEVRKVYEADPSNEVLKRLGKVTFCYRILADPRIGIDPPDLYFIQQFDDAVLKELKHVSQDEGVRVADWVVSADFELWKRVLQKKYKYVTAVIHGDVKVDRGDKINLIGKVAPWADQMVLSYFKTETIWPDEMSPEELAAYRAKVNDFRKKLGV